MSSDYDLLDAAGYSYVQEDEAEWFDPETEEFEACYIEDGRLYIRARIKPEACEAWFAENVPLETYDGETVHGEVIDDAETREIIEINNYLEDSDGAMRRVIHHTAAYDEPQPRRLLNMLWAIDRYCENTVEVTVIVDPGTDHESSGSITAPVGSSFTYRVDNLERAVVFDDPEGTTITHFDGMKDKTSYIFTDPTDEQIESYQAQVQAIQDALAAEPDAAAREAQTAEPDAAAQEAQTAEPDVETLDALVEANTGKAILARHSNLETHRTACRDGEEILSGTSYLDADTCQSYTSDGLAELWLANLGVTREADGEDFKYAEILFDSEEASQTWFENVRDGSRLRLSEGEKLVETIDAGDGRFIAVTEDTDPDEVEWEMTNALPDAGVEYAEGMTIRCEYTFDSQTTDLLSIREILIDAAGEALLALEDTFKYDVEACDPAAEGQPFAQYIADAADPERLRTITIVFDPGTDDEHTEVYVLPHRVYTSIIHNGEFVEHIYADPECTEDYAGGDGVQDALIYVK